MECSNRVTAYKIFLSIRLFSIFVGIFLIEKLLIRVEEATLHIYKLYLGL